RNEDYVTCSRGQTLSGIGTADRGVTLAAAGEPLGDVPERLPFDARAAGDDVAPTSVDDAVAREEAGHDLLLQLGAQHRQRHAHALLAGEVVARFVEGGDVVPPLGVAGDAFGETRPGVALVRGDDDVD